MASRKGSVFPPLTSVPDFGTCCLKNNSKITDKIEYCWSAIACVQITFPDAARAIKAALEVEPSSLPTNYEAFFVNADGPHGRYPNAKAKRLLGWEPQDDLTGYYVRALPPTAAKL